jgi:CRP-like cAMP-binding protein
MTSARPKAVCVDHDWVGRSDCSRCAVLHIVPFAPLPLTDLEEFLGPVTNFQLARGARLLGPESHANAVITLRSGFVKLFETAPSGRERIVRLLGPGDVVGLEALHAPPYLHAAESLTPVDACHLPIPVVHAIEARMPELHASMLARWHRSLEQADRFLVELLDGPAPTRVARLLLMLVELAGDSAPPRLTRLDTASAVDIAPETASRVLTRFIGDGILVEERDSFRIDREALRTIARS